jgi:DNA-binding FrmR family transcriptional regulator
VRNSFAHERKAFLFQPGADDLQRTSNRIGHDGTQRAARTAMDDQSRGDAAVRLSRIAGQVTGLQRMVAEDRYCVDVLLQVAAVRAALAEVGKVVLANHVETCLTEALRSGSRAERRVKVDELMDIFSRYCALGTPSRAPSRVEKSLKSR